MKLVIRNSEFQPINNFEPHSVKKLRIIPYPALSMPLHLYPYILNLKSKNPKIYILII